MLPSSASSPRAGLEVVASAPRVFAGLASKSNPLHHPASHSMASVCHHPDHEVRQMLASDSRVAGPLDPEAFFSTDPHTAQIKVRRPRVRRAVTRSPGLSDRTWPSGMICRKRTRAFRCQAASL
eukprot:761822-Hanusia_phi.AAC.1